MDDKGIDMNDWDFSKVKTYNELLRDLYLLQLKLEKMNSTDIDISDWDLGGVTKMSLSDE